MERKTPLYETHLRYGGKIVPFGGYLLPVQYKAGVVEEHMVVRTKCGLFDVSHMGEVVLTGQDATKNLNSLLTNDYTVMEIGQARYSPMCNKSGGTVDDLIVYKMDDKRYFIVVNASNKDKDYEWMKQHLSGDAALEDISDSIGQLALQGPLSKNVMEKLASQADIPEKYYTFKNGCMIGGIECLISATGYTGEDGYEVYFPAESAEKLWDIIMEAGDEFGILPCGLGARDTLRLEASMPLYGHELSDDITPREAGLGYFVKMDKADFIGKEALLAKGIPERKRVGLRVTGRGIIREHMAIFNGEKEIGYSTSGTHCPYVGAPLAMAMVDSAFSAVGTQVEADVRGRRVAAEVVKLPFYKKAAK